MVSHGMPNCVNGSMVTTPMITIMRVELPFSLCTVSPLSFYFIVYVICFQFFLSHWEKYNTGVLYLPWAYDLSQVRLSVQDKEI